MNRMICAHAADGDLAHRYIRGEMGEEEKASFEQHYFDCAQCFEALQGAWALQAALDDSHASRPIAPVTARPLWKWGAIAAGLAACVTTVVLLRPSKPAEFVSPEPAARQQRTVPPADKQQPDVAMLARIDPPPYVSLPVRAEDDRFEAAMEHYVRRDFAAAARQLRPIAASRPRAAGTQFFLGVSELMLDRPDAAIAALEAAAASGPPQLAEHARFLIAKAWLKQGRLGEARRALEACIRMQGPHAPEARNLLQKF